MRITTLATLTAALALPALASAEPETYELDTEKQHSFIQFRVQHLGFSWLYGRFNDFEGEFTADPDDADDASVEVTIDTASVDTGHAERDKHLRSDEFLHVEKYPEAKFVSTSADLDEEGNGTITGDLTLHGTTREVTLDVEAVGKGEDPWGGYRRGFLGETTIDMRAFGIDEQGQLGPAGRKVELTLSVEGVRPLEDGEQ